MKIAATSVSMDAARNYTEVDQNNTIWQQGNSAPFPFGQTSQSSAGKDFQQNFYTLIHSSSTRQQFGTHSITSQGEVASGLLETDQQVQDRSEGFSSIIQQVTGHSVTIQQVVADSQNQLTTTKPAPLSVGLASLNSTAIHVEHESICFQAEGTVNTECGQTISFNMGLQMQREEVFMQSNGFGRIINGIDPIVLNFDENISMFDRNYFSFDLDGDGSCDQIPGLGSGCGFLALDRNGDGSISDGLELFGPTTGSGFSELATLDNDGNMWIDENDPIFNSLLVWKGAGGEGEQLMSLQEAGVGAISVAHLGTQFTLKDKDGQAQGIVQANGLFLMENGEPKSLQEIDLVPKLDDVEQEAGEVITSGLLTETRAQPAIENLREIIFWQRLKMEMILSRKQLTPSREEMIHRLEHLTDHLRYLPPEKYYSSLG